MTVTKNSDIEIGKAIKGTPKEGNRLLTASTMTLSCSARRERRAGLHRVVHDRSGCDGRLGRWVAQGWKIEDSAGIRTGMRWDEFLVLQGWASGFARMGFDEMGYSSSSLSSFPLPLPLSLLPSFFQEYSQRSEMYITMVVWLKTQSQMMMGLNGFCCRWWWWWR